jgi:anti-sigma regulatory factor (Ser/Thr protein kinase)
MPVIGYSKVIAMSTVERTLTKSYPAIPASVPLARGELAHLAAFSGASPEKLEAVRLAASEALTNAVLHAYPQGPGAVHVTAAVASTELWILIADDGCGLDARSRRPGLGLGLALISQVADDFTIGSRATRGVELQMRFDLAPSTYGRERGMVDVLTRASAWSPRREGAWNR